jgi:mannose-1-phosphate guanylyltransferase
MLHFEIAAANEQRAESSMYTSPAEPFPHDWVLVLAGGEGKRLRQLTLSGDVAVPKQYCSLAGGQTLLDDAIERSNCVVRSERVCVIVAAQHRRWWTPLLEDLPPGNVIVQPRNRGTGIGLMYAALHIHARDPRARIMALPADHYVREEAVLCASLRNALDHVTHSPGDIVLLGMQVDHVDTELGYIVPAAEVTTGVQRVRGFVEKPSPDAAAALIQRGALWNTFIFAGTTATLLDLFSPRYAFTLLEMQTLLDRGAAQAVDWPTLVSLYERLPDVDFSHDVLAGRHHVLRVVDVPRCGWSDLGTPQRVAQTLKSLPFEHPSRRGRSPFVNLATQQALLGTRMAAP